MASVACEKPILFSGPMVRAILDRGKTQTRRVIKPQPLWLLPDRRIEWRHDCLSDYWCARDRLELSMDILGEWRTPYLPGTRLWVRETWAETADIDGTPVIQYKAGGTRLNGPGPSVHHGEHRCTALITRWRPSIFMPHWASRLTLEVTNVRAERVQEITEEDAIAEGCCGEQCYRNPSFLGLVTDDGRLPREEFRDLWDSINAKRGYGWEANPWVWVVTFRRAQP